MYYTSCTRSKERLTDKIEMAFALKDRLDKSFRVQNLAFWSAMERKFHIIKKIFNKNKNDYDCGHGYTWFFPLPPRLCIIWNSPI
jgi:hypothetical protein